MKPSHPLEQSSTTSTGTSGTAARTSLHHAADRALFVERRDQDQQLHADRGRSQQVGHLRATEIEWRSSNSLEFVRA